MITEALGEDWTSEYDTKIEWAAQARFTNKKNGVTFTLRGQLDRNGNIVKFHTFPNLPRLKLNALHSIKGAIPYKSPLHEVNYSPNFTAGIKQDNPYLLLNAISKRTIKPLEEAWHFVTEAVQKDAELNGNKAKLKEELSKQNYRFSATSDFAYSMSKGITVSLCNDGKVLVQDTIYCTPEQLAAINEILNRK